MKYDIKTINSYINGDDIDGYTIEELENDKRFMLLVLKYTKDKNMYHLCSNELKQNYNFLLGVIDLFKKDLDFIITIISEYLNNDNISNIQDLELNIILRNLIDKEKVDDYFLYLFNTRMEYEKDILEIASYKEYIKDNRELLNFIGEGFFIIQDKYEGSKIILDYYAKQFIIDLFDSENINLETLLHESFKTLNNLEKYGINRFLIDIIYKSDNFLGEYISNDISLLDVIKEKIKLIKKRWDNYEFNQENNKWDYLVECIEKYIYDNELEYLFNTKTIMNYLTKKYKIKNNFYNFDVEIQNIKNNMNIFELSQLNNLEKIFLKILNMKYIEDNYIDEVETKNECKVIKLNKIRRINEKDKE